LAWAGSGSDVPTGALYRMTSTASGEADAVAYYDATGRELRLLTSDAFNRKIYSDTKYNAKGQVASTSLPYFSTDAAQWTTCDYLDDGGNALATEQQCGHEEK